MQYTQKNVIAEQFEGYGFCRRESIINALSLTEWNMIRGEGMKGETKEKRFKRVAQKRVQNLLDSLRRLSQCSNKRMYNWEEEQLEKIWEAVEKELKNCKMAFENAEPNEFRL